jgi:hypothetical protein
VRLIDTSCSKPHSMTRRGDLRPVVSRWKRATGPERSEYGCVRLRAVHVRSQQQGRFAMCLLAARSFSGATNAASDQLIVGPGFGKRFSASLKPDAIPEPIRSREGRWLRTRQRAPVLTTRPTPVSALASAPPEQTPGAIQGQRYTSKTSATSELIQQRTQRGRGGERKCVFFCAIKKQPNKNKQTKRLL